MLHTLHRASACLIASFVAVHLVNHLLAVQSIEAHIAFMQAFRPIYRQPVVEVLLLACVVFQIASGAVFIRRRWGQRRGFFERLQAVSGGYLAFFLLVHVGAVLFGRAVLQLDTNFHFAAAGMHIALVQLYFVPYYFLAVAAIFGHLACAAHWLLRDRWSTAARNRLAVLVLVIGTGLAGLIVTAFAGGFYPVEIPQAYTAIYGV